MQLWYNGVALHQAGALEGRGQRWDPDGAGDAPQRMRSTLSVRLHFTEAQFAANRDLVDGVRAALAVPRAVLRWRDDAAGTDYLNQEVAVGPYAWPDDGKGLNRHQTLDLEFSWWETPGASPYLQAQFTPTDGVAVSLTRVTRFSETYAATRPAALQPQRSGARGKVSLSGQYPGDVALAAAARTAALLSQKEAWVNAMNQRDGRLVYGPLDRVVRLEEFTCDLAADGSSLLWNLTAEFSRFPAETSGVLAEYEVATRQEAAAGQSRVTLSGRIVAPTALLARAKLESLRAAVRSAQAAGVNLAAEASEITESQIDADTDGTAFIELRFNEGFTATLLANTVSWSLRLSDDEDAQAQTVRRSYAGNVRARGASWSAAYQAAVTKARSLGEHKHQSLLSGRVSANDDQQSADYAGTETVRYCTVEFEWTYLLRGGTALWMELRSEYVAETFGADRETISGRIAAASAAAARSLYETVKTGYAGYLIEGERVSEVRLKRTRDNLAPVGATYSPPLSAVGWGTVVNALEVTDDVAEPGGGAIIEPPLLGAGSIRQWSGLDFSLNVFRPKAAGAIALRYEQDAVADYVRRTIATRYSGTVWADTRAHADAAIDLLLPEGQSWLTDERREERLRLVGALNATGDDRPADPAGYLVSLAFSVASLQPIAGEDALLEVELSEEIQFSGPRLVVQPTAFGRDVVQECGVQSGSRTVRAAAVASTEALAIAWCRAQYALAFPGDLGGAPASRYRQPPRFSVVPSWTPLLADPAARGEGANSPLWKASFEFTEIMPDYDFVP